MTPRESTRLPSRRRYIDWARGLAVLIMIGAHTLDAWTRAASKSGPVYQFVAMLGGFAAPLFLFLAGLSLALSASGSLDRTGSRTVATAVVVRRAAEIFVLAFLFRLQAFIVSPGGWLVNIFRVDILNVMGLSLGAAGVIWGLAGTAKRAVLVSSLGTVAIAMATPVVRNAEWIDQVPLWVQWHLRPFGDHTTFTLFPWAGFVLAGTATGTLLTMWSRALTERVGLAAIAVTGVVLIWLGLLMAARPSVYTSSSFWTSSPTFFAIRVGVLLLALAALYAIAEAAPSRLRGMPALPALELLGQNSLFLYWIHVELVYGYATWPIRAKLPLWGTALAFVAFTALMYAAIGWRDRVVVHWRQRGLRGSPARAVPA